MVKECILVWRWVWNSAQAEISMRPRGLGVRNLQKFEEPCAGLFGLVEVDMVAGLGNGPEPCIGEFGYEPVGALGG
jgi:hypothetical protein